MGLCTSTDNQAHDLTTAAYRHFQATNKYPVVCSLHLNPHTFDRTQALVLAREFLAQRKLHVPDSRLEPLFADWHRIDFLYLATDGDRLVAYNCQPRR